MADESRNSYGQTSSSVQHALVNAARKLLRRGVPTVSGDRKKGIQKPKHHAKQTYQGSHIGQGGEDREIFFEFRNLQQGRVPSDRLEYIPKLLRTHECGEQDPRDRP